MPRIPDEVVNLATFHCRSAKDSTDPVPPGGVGVAVFRPVGKPEQEQFACYVVTNSHVIVEGGLHVTIGRTQHSRPTQPLDWTHAAGADDLAVWPLPGLQTIRGRSGVFYPGLLADEATFERLDVGIGDEIFSIGSGGEVNGWAPIVRFGNLVSWPARTMRDGRSMDVELLLGEMRSRGGDSGSPVFIHIGGGSVRGEQREIVPHDRQGIAFVGLTCGHVPITESASIVRDGEESMIRIKNNTNISLIIPWTRVIALIDEVHGELHGG